MERPWLYVGAKVVCVDNRPTPGKIACPKGERPVVGATYTVREIDVSPQCGLLGIRLCEITRSQRYKQSGEEALFLIWRFRPLHDCSATIAALRQAAIDAVKNASGGAGIKRGVRV